MKISEIIRLAFEALLGSKMRSALTMLGMIIGVGAVVLLVSIGNGAKNYIKGEFEGLGTNLIMVQPGRTDAKSNFGPPVGSSRKKMTLADVEALRKQAFSIDAVTGVSFGAVQVEHEDRTNNVNGLGVNEEFTKIFNMKIARGSFFTQDEDESGRRVTVLGAEIAKNLFYDQEPLGKLVKINDSEFRVIGVIEKSGESLGFNMDLIAFMPTRTAMRLFNEDKLFGIRAKARSRSSIDDAVAEVKSILKTRMNGQEDFTIVTQVSMLESMNTILNMLTYVLGGIAMISMLVGGIGIMNIMLVNVTERTREIGIRRAVGASRRDVLMQFLAEALTLSLTGGFIGVFGSMAITYTIYFAFPKFDMRAPAWVLFPAFFMSLITGLFFGVWPARKASTIETIEALRFE